MATTERREPGREGQELRAKIDELASRIQLDRRMRGNPYPVLGLAFGAGYIAGGGLFSPVSRPLVRALLGVLLWPRLREQAAGVASGLRGRAVTGTAQA